MRRGTPFRIYEKWDIGCFRSKLVEWVVWTAFRDWETVRALNEVVEDVAGLRRFCAPPEDRTLVKVARAAALDAIERSIPKFGIEFRVSSIEILAVLWPGSEARERIRAGADPDSMDEILESVLA